MSRASRRPPRLDATPAPATPRGPREPTARARIVQARLAGRHDRLGSREVRSVMRRVALGERDALLGLPRFEVLTEGEVEAVARVVWGWRDEDANAWTDPDRTVDAARAAIERIADVARRGGRIAFATGRPASMLPLGQELARRVERVGGEVLTAADAGPFPAAGRGACRLWWSAGVAVITDGDALLADVGMDAAQELLFALPRPDLVVADRGFAGVAAGAGLEVVAWADLDAVALGVALSRGWPLTVVPLRERRPPAAYASLLGLAGAALPA